MALKLVCTLESYRNLKNYRWYVLHPPPEIVIYVQTDLGTATVNNTF